MADISITGFALDGYRGTGDSAYLQIVSESQWTDVDGDSHLAGSYEEVPLDVNEAAHRIDETDFSLTPTQNAITNQLATYRFQVVDENHKHPLVVARGVSVPYSTPVMAWGSLMLIAQSQSPWRDVTSPTTTDMVNYVQSQLGAVVTPDASATVRGFVNTLAQTFAGLKTFLGGIIARVWDKGGAVFDIRAYGALCDWAGTGTGTDDTVAVQAALTACLAANGRLYIPGFTKITSTLTVNKSIEIFGNGPAVSGLVLASSMGASADGILVSPPATGSVGPNLLSYAGRNNRGYYLHDFSIQADSGTPGRNGIRVSTATANQFIHNSMIERVHVHLLGGAPSLYFDNESGGTHANLDGIFRITVRDCVFWDGFAGAYIGDTISFISNSFREFTSSNRALDVWFTPGAAGFNFAWNNVYNIRGIRFKNGIKPIIGPGNMIEGPEVGGLGSNGAMLDLDGSLSTISGATVFKNHIGMLSGSPAHGVRVNDASDVILEDNSFNIQVGQNAIVTTASAVRPHIGRITMLSAAVPYPTPLLGTAPTYAPLIYFGVPPLVLPGYFSIEQGSFQRFNTAVVTYTADVTLTLTDLNSTVVMNSAGARVAKLPPHNTGQSAGRILRFRNIGSNTLTVQKADGTAATIDGAATLVIAAGGKATLQATEVAEVWLTV